MGLKYYDIATLPRLYDIVWCRFPLAEQPNWPGPKLRPALVRGSLLDKATGRGAVRVSYGTTRLDRNKHEEIDLIIENFERRQRLGLPMATRFDLDPKRMNQLPWCEEFFCPPPHSTEVVAGHLTDEYIDRLRRRLKKRGIIR